MDIQKWEIPASVTNPKTRRRYERLKADFDNKFSYAEMNGYAVEKRGTNIWSFSKNGVRSVLGFDSGNEVLDFIYENNPDPEKIFPPYSGKQKE